MNDLTTGSVWRSISFFALPMLLGNILQQTYNIIDTWIVGKWIGSGALAGVGSSYTLMVFLTSILIGLCMGSGVVFSLCFGKKDDTELKNSIGASFVLIAVITVILTAAPLFLLKQIILWLNIPAEIQDLTSNYLRIIFYGIPAVFIYNYFAAYLKAIGNSIIPLLFLGISTVLNIILDILFVVKFHLGAGGAATATILSQYVSGIGITLYVLSKYPLIRLALSHLEVHHSSMKQIANYSILTCLQQSVMNLGILMVQSLVNSFGTAVMAAFAAGVKIDSFAYMPAQEYGNAFSTFTAQNIGAEKRERVKSGIKCAIITILVYCGLASLILWFLAKPLLQIFIDSSETTIIAEGVRYLHIEGAFYIGIGLLFFFYGIYRALGKPEMSLILTIISLGTRVILAYTLAPQPSFGVSAIWWAIPIGWALADLVGGICLIRWRKKLL